MTLPHHKLVEVLRLFNNQHGTRGGGSNVGLRYSSFLCVGHVNLNCLANKISYVTSLLLNNNIDVLGVSETWLTGDKPDSFVAVDNYRILRGDDPTPIRKHGVAVYIRDGIKYEEVLNDKNIVVLKLPDHDIYIATIYRPPSYSPEENRGLVQLLQEHCTSREVILQGDFNLPSLLWNNDDPAESYVSPIDRSFLELFISLGLTQVVKEPTSFPSGNTIDLCLLSHPDRLGSVAVEPPLPACNHGIVIVEYTFQTLESSKGRSPKRIWTKGNFARISEALEDINWEAEFMGLNTQEMYDKFLALIAHPIERFIPISQDRVGKPPWTLNPPRSMTRRRKLLFTVFKETRSSQGRRHPLTHAAWVNFTEANNQLKQFSMNSQQQYEIKIAEQIKTSPKLFHSYLRHRRVGRPSTGPLKTDDGNITDDPTLMAKQFAQSFLGVFTSTPPPNPAAHQTAGGTLPAIHVTPEHVEREIKTLDANTSMGADEVHPRFLSRCASVISIPLSLIYNCSLQEGRLPVQWLSSQITPIFKKKGVRKDPLNYRPVAVTSVPCKVLEKVIVVHLKIYLEENQILSEHQFGFRSGHSTIDQLVTCYDFVTKGVDQGKMVDIVFFDFSKAFDTVSHPIMIAKLKSIGICTQLVNWIQEFLVARRMQVRVQEGRSSWHQVTSGVPQGSVLGPMLFLIYVNHVVDSLVCNYKIFADDIKLYITNKPLDKASGIEQLQRDINTLVETAKSWGLCMNVSKCKCLRFGPRSLGNCDTGRSPYSIGQTNLKYTHAHDDLGVKVDRKLKFHDHIRKTANTCNALTNNIFCSTLCREPEFILNIYKSLVRPKLEYGSPIWNLGYLGDIRLLERVQRKWTRRVRGLSELPYSERLRQLDLFSVQGRLLRADLILTWRILAGESAVQGADLFILDRASRRGHSKKLFLPRSNLEVRRRYFSSRVISAWNSLTDEAVCATSLTQFKCFLHRDLGQQLYQYVD